jgi:hypothetical protein
MEQQATPSRKIRELPIRATDCNKVRGHIRRPSDLWKEAAKQYPSNKTENQQKH